MAYRVEEMLLAAAPGGSARDQRQREPRCSHVQPRQVRVISTRDRSDKLRQRRVVAHPPSVPGPAPGRKSDLVSRATKEYGRRIERLSAWSSMNRDLTAELLGALTGSPRGSFVQRD